MSSKINCLIKFDKIRKKNIFWSWITSVVNKHLTILSFFIVLNLTLLKFLENRHSSLIILVFLASPFLFAPLLVRVLLICIFNNLRPILAQFGKIVLIFILFLCPLFFLSLSLNPLKLFLLKGYQRPLIYHIRAFLNYITDFKMLIKSTIHVEIDLEGQSREHSG